MTISDDARRLLTLCALSHPDGRIEWSLIARQNLFYISSGCEPPSRLDPLTWV